MSKKYVIVTTKYWHIPLFDNLKRAIDGDWIFIDKEDDFSFDNLKKITPDYVFIPHWSKIIPSEIFENFNCIVFHMTDLPFGRGGSPLQNLISRGIYDTKISAIKVCKELDAGDIYLKMPLSLFGSAEEIFLRAAEVIEKMISLIINENIAPIAQKGEPTIFKRRKPTESNIAELNDIIKLYDYIRMLDAEDYPKAFLETEYFKIEFNKATLKFNKSIEANVRIFKK